MARAEHHFWCNFFGMPVEGCKQCERLYREYPYEPGEEMGLYKEHFPNAVVRLPPTPPEEEPDEE